MVEEIESFYNRFNIELDNEGENKKRFKNALVKILEITIGNITLTKEFRDIFITCTGIEHKDFGTVDCYTEIDLGTGSIEHDIFGKRYIKFYDTCIGKAFLKDDNYIFEYLQIIFSMSEDIISNDIKEELYIKINEVVKLFRINVIIIKENNKYLLLPQGAKELDKALVMDVLIWLKDFNESREKFIEALKKFQNKDDIRNILDDLRFSFEKFIQELLGNTKSLENNKSEIGEFLDCRNINKEIKNLYIKVFDYYTKYQNENVKHSEKCNSNEVEFIIYLTGNLIRLLVNLR